MKHKYGKIEFKIYVKNMATIFSPIFNFYLIFSNGVYYLCHRFFFQSVNCDGCGR